MANRKPALKWIYDNSKYVFIALFILMLIGILLSYAGVRLAMVSQELIDIVTSNLSGSLYNNVWKLVILIVLQLILQVFYSTLNIRISGKLNISFKRKLFSDLLNKGWQDIGNYHSGELINRINSDITVVTNGIVSIVPSAISFLSRIIFSFIVLFRMDFTFSLIFLFVGILIMIVSRIYSNKMKGLHKKCQESNGKTLSFMQECLQNLLAIKSFNNEDLIIEHSTKLQDKNYDYTIKRNNISIVANVLFFISLTAGYYFALVWGAYKISKGLMTFGALTAMLQLVSQVNGPFRNLLSVVPQYYSMLASAERVMEIEDLQEERVYNLEKLDLQMIYRDMVGVKFEDVSFYYDVKVGNQRSEVGSRRLEVGSREREEINDIVNEGLEGVINNASLFIKKGEFIAVSGQSGVGKSTFLMLLLGIISPTSGEIFFDLNNGIKLLVDKKVRGLFAYVPQGNMILSGTIRENITFSKEIADDEDIIRSAKVAEIWDFILSLPEGLNTLLGEKGLGLSEGQIQRIAIARAIFHNSPIILLDEATSALDEKTEMAVVSNIKKLKDKTCIFVSHRKAAYKVCDKYIFIKDGSLNMKDID